MEKTDEVHVLVVDPDVEVRAELYLLLEKVFRARPEKLDIDLAKEMQTAFEQTDKKNHDLIFVANGEFDFQELIRKVKKRNSDFSWMLVTEQTPQKLRVEAQRSGVSGFLSKPFNIDSVNAAVELVLDLRR